MDYGFLTCHTLFTMARADRMSTALSSSRASLPAICMVAGVSGIVPSSWLSILAVSNVSIGSTPNLSNFSTGATSYEWFLNGISVFTHRIWATYFLPRTYIITMIASNGDSSCTKSAADTIRWIVQQHFTYSTSNCIPKKHCIIYQIQPAVVWLVNGCWMDK